jgi:hypothetical protein
MYVVYANTLHLTGGVAWSVDVGSVVCHTVFNKEDLICQNFVLLSIYLGADTIECKSFQGSLYAHIFYDKVFSIFHGSVLMLVVKVTCVYRHMQSVDYSCSHLLGILEILFLISLQIGKHIYCYNWHFSLHMQFVKNLFRFCLRIGPSKNKFKIGILE